MKKKKRKQSDIRVYPNRTAGFINKPEEISREDEFRDVFSNLMRKRTRARFMKKTRNKFIVLVNHKSCDLRRFSLRKVLVRARLVIRTFPFPVMRNRKDIRAMREDMRVPLKQRRNMRARSGTCSTKIVREDSIFHLPSAYRRVVVVTPCNFARTGIYMRNLQGAAIARVIFSANCHCIVKGMQTFSFPFRFHERYSLFF